MDSVKSLKNTTLETKLPAFLQEKVWDTHDLRHIETSIGSYNVKEEEMTIMLKRINDNDSSSMYMIDDNDG